MRGRSRPGSGSIMAWPRSTATSWTSSSRQPFKVRLAEIVPESRPRRRCAPAWIRSSPTSSPSPTGLRTYSCGSQVRSTSRPQIRDAYQAAVAAALAEAAANGTAPVKVTEPPSHGVEIWGGAPNKDGHCSRQFGVDGVHGFDDADALPVSWYGWADDRPALHEVGLEDLPCSDAGAGARDRRRVRGARGRHGLVALEVTMTGEGVGDDVFDINRDDERGSMSTKAGSSQLCRA